MKFKIIGGKLDNNIVEAADDNKINVAKPSISLTVKDDNNMKEIENTKLDVLIKSENPAVREIAAKKGYGLDILVHDENWQVREAVANQGFGLDILINDENHWVRAAVADQGFGLHILIEDEDLEVRRAVVRSLSKLDDKELLEILLKKII